MSKCVDCGAEFDDTPKKQQIKVNLSNPGVVFFGATASKCENCGQQYVTEENLEDALNAFEDAYNETKKKK